MQLKISNDTPTDINLWNKLCEENGNLVQSTHFDEVQLFFKQKPIYFEVWSNNILIAGVKFYFWESSKIGLITKILSKRLSQHGELLLSHNYLREKAHIINLLQKELTSYIKQHKIVTYACGNLYGNTTLLLKPAGQMPTKITEFLTAYVDIDKNEDELLASFNRNTKRNIKKAIEGNINFELTSDIERFLQIEQAVYNQQPGISPPNFDYIRHIYNNSANNILIGLSTAGKTDLAGGFFYIFGDSAFSVFGGAKSNNIGAGHFFYFEMMKYLSKQGIKKFYFGQIAKEIDKNNEKFSVGITNFKRGFRGEEIESEKLNFVINHKKKKLWKILLAVNYKIN